MSINPVQGIENIREVEFAGTNPRPEPARPSASENENSDEPDPGTAPSQEIRVAQTVSTSPELPQDEVQVQRDSDADDEIVIKYVDHSGNLILQVPSSEVLGLARAIGEDFQQHAKARAASPETVGEGEKNHGH